MLPIKNFLLFISKCRKQLRGLKLMNIAIVNVSFIHRNSNVSGNIDVARFVVTIRLVYLCDENKTRIQCDTVFQPKMHTLEWNILPVSCVRIWKERMNFRDNDPVVTHTWKNEFDRENSVCVTNMKFAPYRLIEKNIHCVAKWKHETKTRNDATDDVN